MKEAAHFLLTVFVFVFLSTPCETAETSEEDLSNQELAERIFLEVSQSSPEKAWLVVVYRSPASYGEYRQLLTSMAGKFPQPEGRFAVLYSLERSDPRLLPLEPAVLHKVTAVWTESMPVVKHETDGFVILLGRLLGFQRQVRYLDGAARGWNVTSTAA